MQALIDTLPVMIAMSVSAVIAMLIAGIGMVTVDGLIDRRLGQGLMRLRVGLQVLSLVLIVTYVCLGSTS
jgi:hypothetical protein